MRAIPVLRGDFFQWSERADETGVVERDVEPAILCGRARDERFDIGFGGDVGFLEDGRAAVFLAGTHCGLAAFLIQVGDDHGRALASETNRGLTPHPARSPGYNRNFVIESAHAFVLKADYFECSAFESF